MMTSFASLPRAGDCAGTHGGARAAVAGVRGHSACAGRGFPGWMARYWPSFRQPTHPPRTREAIVIGDKEAVATIAVKDINAAKKFYEGTLGLKPTPSAETGVLVYGSGKTKV